MPTSMSIAKNLSKTVKSSKGSRGRRNPNQVSSMSGWTRESGPLRKTEAYQAIMRKRDQLNKELMVVLE